MRMKTITVPISAEALARLETDSCVAGDVAEVSLTQAQFDELWRCGLFQALNSRLGVLIDEYEDARLPAESLSLALGIVQEFACKCDLEPELRDYF